MEEKISISVLAQQRLDELLTVLVENEYFGFLDTAEGYVSNIYSVIYNVATQRKFLTKRNRYGAWYCKYKANRTTTWYITFDTDGEFYIIRNIINNHTKDYPTFIRGLK